MLQLPKFVRERLKASVSPVGHPDPDMLTAFSERALPAHERAVVMEHLARCGECRDVVALALPATEAAPAPHTAPHRDWFHLPALRWGTAVAGILVVATVGIQQYRTRHATPPTVARFMDHNQTAQNEVAQNSAPQAEMRTPLHESSEATLQPQAKEEDTPRQKAGQNALQNDGRASTAASGVLGRPVLLSPPQSARTAHGNAYGVIGGIGGGAGEGRYTTTAPQGTKLAMNSPPKDLFLNPSLKSAPAPATAAKQLPPAEPGQKVPSMSEVVEVQSAPPPVTTQDQAQGQRQDQKFDYYQSRQQQTDAEQAHLEGDKALSKAKPAAPPAASNSAVTAATPPAQPLLMARVLALPTPAPTWTISSTGALQRSFDGGKSWQDIDVNATLTTSRSFAVTEVVADAITRDDNKIEKKSLPRAKAPPVFRAVAANGSDVWAGGSAGTLYHSVDAGNHWTRIIPSAGSVALTADIASIQFSDPQHGAITTVTSELWTTTDAGRSWQKQ